MDLQTTYLGLRLRSPLVPSASPLSESLDNIRRMEDAGAGAVVLHSLFEEQLRAEQNTLMRHLLHGSDSYAEALSYVPHTSAFHRGPDAYLDHIRRAKQQVDIPIIASLNTSTGGPWTKYARQIEEAGADALELNIYGVPTNPEQTSQDIERQYLEIVRAVCHEIKIPLALKLSPFFTSLVHLAGQFVVAGADGLVLFNRFYQPDIDLRTLEVHPHVILSSPVVMRLPMRWIAILYGRVRADLAATSGIHTAPDVLKMLMVGARVTMVCSVLLKRGIEYLGTLERDMILWMTEHEYESVAQMQGSLSQQHCPDPGAFERAQYTQALIGFDPHEAH